MPERIYRVKVERDAFLYDLQQDVDLAFARRKVVELIGDTTTETLSEAQRFKELIELLEAVDPSGKTILPQGNTQDNERPNRAYVTNLHDYPDLLHMAMEKLRPGISRNTTRFHINQILAHEYAHSIPILGDPSVRAMYAVEFIQDANSGKPLFTPVLSLAGNLKLSTYKAILQAPDNPSSIDRLQVI